MNNSFESDGYRKESGYARTCFAGWLYLHSETLTILPPDISAVLPGRRKLDCGIFEPGYSHAKPLDCFIFAFFLLNTFICLPRSSTYHLLISSAWLKFICYTDDDKLALLEGYVSVACHAGMV